MSTSPPFRSSLLHARRATLAWSGLSLATGILCASGVTAAHAAKAPRAREADLEPFDQSSWPALLAQLPRPAVVLFSSLHCPTCPEAARRAFDTRNRLQPDAPMVVVLTDGADDPARSRNSYQSVATRLMVFDGLPAVLRREVSPRWRGETPWFVLLNRTGSPVMQAGVPAAGPWEEWAFKR